MTSRLVFAFLLGVLGATGSVFASDSPHVWLERMSKAVDELNYRGTFVHKVGNRMQNMRVIHRVHDGNVLERLVSLDGDSREIIFDGKETRCILEKERQVLVERHDGSNPLRAALPRFDKALEAHYSFVMSGQSGRVAGRDVRLIEVQPRDEYRYGYQLWLDTQTALPLQTALIGERGRVVERVLFSQVEFPESIPEEELHPTLSDEGFSWHIRKVKVDGEDDAAETDWAAGEVPAGFALSAATREVAESGQDEADEHLVYSDGLASVSVFVEDLPSNHEPLNGSGAVGPANTFSTIVGKYQVTVVGEVPASTVRMIGSSFRATPDRR